MGGAWAGIPWGAASRSGHDRPAPLALDPGGLCCFTPLQVINHDGGCIVWGAASFPGSSGDLVGVMAWRCHQVVTRQHQTGR